MRKLSPAVVLTMALVSTLSSALAQNTDPSAPTAAPVCSDLIKRLESAIKEYKRAKFSLDRATQLMASARYSSRIGKMNIDLASRQADVTVATASYVESIGPAYSSVAALNADCGQDAFKESGIRFTVMLNLDITRFISEGVDKLADEQMADIKKVFGDMKSRQK
ncbi:TPA: hypothetical protein IHM15_004543 [Escherichia coli]|nr:hypothetical protein [Escherichia coli]